MHKALDSGYVIEDMCQEKKEEEDSSILNIVLRHIH